MPEDHFKIWLSLLGLQNTPNASLHRGKTPSTSVLIYDYKQSAGALGNAEYSFIYIYIYIKVVVVGPKKEKGYIFKNIRSAKRFVFFEFIYFVLTYVLRVKQTKVNTPHERRTTTPI